MTPEPDQPLNLLQALVSLLVPSVAVQNGIPEADDKLARRFARVKRMGRA